MDFMQRALDLARKALGWCSPNPAVGAVLVRDGRIVGEGFTQPPGGAHAEIVALRQAGEAATAATLYVTLEPCSHFGRTPPCTEAIISAGVAEVRVATGDPSPWVAGGGMRTLQAAGIRCAAGECEIEARRLNEAYFKWVHAGTPFVTLKYAMTADGKIATRGGSSFWVSGLEARQRVAQLRSMVDAVLVGVGTVLADDPQLTARPGEVGLPVAGPVHQPLRVVLDSTARTPTIAKVLGGAARTIICTTERAAADRRAALEAKGAEVLVLDERDGRVDVGAALRALGDRGVISVLSEAGGTVAWSLLEAGAVDKVLAFIAPKLVGGREALSPIGGLGLDRMDCAVELATPEWTVLGRDVLLTAYVEPLSQVRQG